MKMEERWQTKEYIWSLDALKKQKGNRFCLQGFPKEQVLPKPGSEPREIDF